MNAGTAGSARSVAGNAEVSSVTVTTGRSLGTSAAATMSAGRPRTTPTPSAATAMNIFFICESYGPRRPRGLLELAQIHHGQQVPAGRRLTVIQFGTDCNWLQIKFIDPDVCCCQGRRHLLPTPGER